MSLPLTDTTARFLTSPRSIHSFEPFLNQSGEASTVFVYVATPEKYLTPGSSFRLQSESSSSLIEAGAPRPGWNATVQGPSTAATGTRTTGGRTREVSVVGLLNTTKT